MNYESVITKNEKILFKSADRKATKLLNSIKSDKIDETAHNEKNYQ
jgi:hypothetical protein